jgi:hypothetical protein
MMDDAKINKRFGFSSLLTDDERKAGYGMDVYQGVISVGPPGGRLEPIYKRGSVYNHDLEIAAVGVALGWKGLSGIWSTIAKYIAGIGTAGATGATAKVVDYLVQNAENLKHTAKVAGEIAERGYINSTLIIQEIMKSADPIKDTFLQNGLKWVVEGVYNGSKGVYELVVNVDTQTIVHFLFRSVK